MSLKQKLKKIEWIVSDVDGVLTDGNIIVTDGKEELKEFSVKDGLGVTMGKRMGLSFAIISGRDAPCARYRLEEQLQLREVHLGKFDDKEATLIDIAKRHSLPLDAFAYIGDDLIDIRAMKRAGVSFCPRDAAKEVRAIANVRMHANGGKGALREAVEIVLSAKGLYGETLTLFGA